MSLQSGPCSCVRQDPTTIAEGGLCSKAQVYRIGDRFVEHRLAGLADAREDNGENKVTEKYEAELLSILEGSPQDHSYLRPTWTQELLILVLDDRRQLRFPTVLPHRRILPRKMAAFCRHLALFFLRGLC